METESKSYRCKSDLDEMEEIRFQLTFISEALCQPRGTEYSEMALNGCSLMLIHIMHSLDALIEQMKTK